MVGDTEAAGQGGLVLLTVALLLTVPLAGCAENGGGAGDGADVDGETFAAQAQLSTAREVAQEWSSEAELVAISTQESERPPERWPADAFAFTPDPSVGDGLAPQWMYFFQDGGGEVLGVLVNAEGETYKHDQAQTDSQPFSSWSVESPAALEAAEANETFASIAEAEGSSIMYFLSGPRTEGEAPSWTLKAFTDEDEQLVIVNAENGEISTAGR